MQTGEIDSSAYLCHGTDGTAGSDGVSALILMTELPVANAMCPAGGQRLETGMDNGDGDSVASDGVLQPEEIDAVAYLCRALDRLVDTAVEPPGENCPGGGVRVDIGLDLNVNGTLDDDEISESSYTCNGNDGRDALIDAIALPVGDNTCPDGGQRIHTGTDDNRNGTLDDDEIDDIATICQLSTNNGCNASDGAPSVYWLLPFAMLVWRRRRSSEMGC